jgi:membrane-associated phospholipid phosphatase
VIGAFYLEGIVAHDDLSRVTAEDSLGASILSGTLTYVLKEAVGRSRPSAHQGAYHFTPFSGSASFPSGHATQAFAIASVIAARYGDKVWIDTLAYGTASLVATARIYHNAHFASDVLAGALIGHAIGRLVVRHRDQMHGSKVTLAPVAGPGFTGLAGGGDF